MTPGRRRDPRAWAADLLARPGLRRLHVLARRRRKVLLASTLALGILAMVVHWS